MKKYKYSVEIVDTIKKFLNADNWKYAFDEELGLFWFDIGINGPLKNIHYFIDVRETEFMVYGISPIGVDTGDKNMRIRMAEFICLANEHISNGNFSLGVDGEINYKCFVDCDGQIPPSYEVIKNSIYFNYAMIEHYAKGIVGIIFSGKSAEQGIAECSALSADETEEILEVVALRKDDEKTEDLVSKLVKRLNALKCDAVE